MTLTLSRLLIEYNSYGPNKGKHTGEVSFTGETGKIELKLTPELCHALFLTVANHVTDIAKEAATRLVIESVETKALFMSQANASTPTA